MQLINTWPGWECVRQLGAGAFGKVYEIQKEENGKVYKAALKVISIPQNESDIESAFSEGMDRHSVTEYFKSFVNDFSNEISLMSDLKGYTNIVSYEDHMVIPHENGIGWDILIRMELLIPLLKWVIDHPLSEDDVIRLGCDMCQALILCHKNKIIHRDIKPENIFVNKNGDFKLGDFGIARVVERTASVMSQKGTYTYMAPEVFKGQNYNETADIYSLGIVLYRFLNENRTPFLPMGNLVYTDRQVAQDRRMSGEPIPSPKNGSEKLKNLVLTSVNYNPANRFQSALIMKKALEKCEVDVFENEKLVHTEETTEKNSQNEMEYQGGNVFGDYKKTVENQNNVQFENETEFEDEKTVAKPQYIPQSVSDKGTDAALTKKRKKWLVPISIIGAMVAAILIVLFSTKVVRPIDYYQDMHNVLGAQIEMDQDYIQYYASLENESLQSIIDISSIPAKSKVFKTIFEIYLSKGKQLGSFFNEAKIIEVYKLWNTTVSIAEMDYSMGDAQMIIVYKDDIAEKVYFKEK